MSVEWRTTKLRGTLLDTIDSAVSELKVYGTRKYDSVPDFIQQACVRLLKDEGYKLQEAMSS